MEKKTHNTLRISTGSSFFSTLYKINKSTLHIKAFLVTNVSSLICLDRKQITLSKHNCYSAK